MSSPFRNSTILGLLLLAPLSTGLFARVHMTPEGALQAAFPGARIEKKRLYLSVSQKEELEKSVGRPVRSRLYTVYVATDAGGRRLGMGFFQTEKVRSKEQTLFIVVSPDQRIRNVFLISFYEPDEYTPPERWLKLLLGKGKADALIPGVDLPVISGATLTTRACADTAKLVLRLARFAEDIP